MHEDVPVKQQQIIGWNPVLVVQNAGVWDVTTLSNG